MTKRALYTPGGNWITATEKQPGVWVDCHGHEYIESQASNSARRRDENVAKGFRVAVLGADGRFAMWDDWN